MPDNQTPPIDTAQIAADLKLATLALAQKKKRYDVFWNYYDGRVALRWSAEKIREVFKRLVNFTENWSAVVIDSAFNRIELESVRYLPPTNEATETQLEPIDIASDFNIDEESRAVYLDMLVTGEGFIILDKIGDDVEVFHNDSRNVAVFYETDNPRKMRYAAKWYVNDSKHVTLVLYYETSIDIYVSTSKVNSHGTANISDMKFALQETIANPFTRIPVFHFRQDKRMRSELVNVIPLQDQINKLVSDMMITSEFSAYRQRWMVTNAMMEGGKIPLSPGTTTAIPKGDVDLEPTQVGEWSASDLNNYIDPINDKKQAIAVITSTPRHFFFGSGNAPSGEALNTMEAPLNKKVNRINKTTRRVWASIAVEILQQSGGVNVESNDIEVVFISPASTQPRTDAETININVSAGMPITTALKTFSGWTDARIEKMVNNDAPVSRLLEQTLDLEHGAPRPPVSASTQTGRTETGERNEVFAGEAEADFIEAATAILRITTNGTTDSLAQSGAAIGGGNA